MKSMDTGMPLLMAATASFALPPIDMAFYGLAGAIIGAGIMLITLMSAPELPTKTLWVQFAVRAVASGVVGTMFAWIGGHGIVYLLALAAEHFIKVPLDHETEFNPLVGLLLGFGAWRLLPLLMERGAHEISNRGKANP
jgi:hypothetical protein